MLGYDPHVSISDALDLVDLSGICGREGALDYVRSGKMGRWFGRVIDYPLAWAISVGRPGQGFFPFSTFAASSPSSISRRMASARVGMWFA